MSHGFEEMLEKTLRPDSLYKQDIFRQGEEHYAAEMFRFYSAILTWERECMQTRDK